MKLDFFSFLRWLWMGPSIILLTACGLISPVKLPPMATYTISANTPVIHPYKSRTRLTLLISLPIASPGYQSAKMIYLNVPYRLRSYADNKWVSPPARLLLPLIAQRLQQAAYFKAVVVAPFVGLVDYRLDTQLLVLQQEFITPVSAVRLSMQATLVNQKTNRIMASRQFDVVVPAPGNNPYSGVLATNTAVELMTNKIAQFTFQAMLLKNLSN